MKRPALGSASSRCALLVALSALAVTACGGQRLDANEARGNYTVDVPVKAFPTTQTLSQSTHLVLMIRNDSNKTIPDIAVTICNVTCKFPAPPGEGTTIKPFAECAGPSGHSCLTAGGWAPAGQNQGPGQPLASLSRQVWIVDRPPGPCTGLQGFSCAAGSYGGAATEDANTWALGPLKPGATAKFDWAVTAVKPGRHTVAWEVSAGLNGKAKAVLTDGSIPQGTFPVNITATPPQTYVNNGGQIVSAPSGG
jgi:hypothetical protein